MSLRILLAGLFLALPLAPSRAPAEDSNKESPSELALEISALRTLYYLKATPEQAQALLKIAKETAGTMKKGKPPKVSAEYKRLLVEVRDALAEDDEDQVEDLEDQLEKLTLTETPELDNEVRLTDAACKQAPRLLKQFQAQQIATFLGLYADQIADPLERLRDALGKVRGWGLAEWKEQRDALGEEIAKLVAGVDKAKAAKTRDAVVELLAKARTLKQEKFESRRDELRREAERIVGDVGPMEILRHVTEHALAEMLSNPRVEAALQARAK